MGLNFGKFDRLITVRAMSGTGQDASGQPNDDWTDKCAIWCQVMEQTGREIMAAGEERSAQKTVMFTTRYRTDILETMRLSWDGDEYDIDYIRQIGRREGLQIIGIRRSGK